MKKTAVFSNRNYLILLAALITLGAGFYIMTLDKEPYGFGFLGLTLGPALVVLGLIVPLFSIFPFRTKTDETENFKTFRKWNNLVGWLVFSIALFVYIRTLEPTASFWDAGEFIACAYKLQVPHPPGAPLFLLIGRMFSFLSFGDVKEVAFWVNMVSAISSAFTVLFLYWSVTLLARKTVLKTTENPTASQLILILGSGAVAALSYAFSDSFWFSAVEAEVYALSAFFTAIVVWAMLRWEAEPDETTQHRWLILIAYLIGLSIGVHLLNLLAIPAMAFIYFYRKHTYSFKNVALTFFASLILIAIIMWGIIPGLPALAGNFEIFFINAIGLPFGSGIIIFLLLFIAALVYGIRNFTRKEKPLLQTVLLSFVYILVGYSSYLIIPIRSSYNPLIDENNPEDIISFVSYLRREQYGERPLFYGPQFSSELIDQKEDAPIYAKTKTGYEEVDHKIEPVYAEKSLRLLPRLYSNSAVHLNEYRKWVNLEDGKIPTMSENLSYLLRYQFGHMYWRYFGWNFIGRDSDKYNAGVQWPWENQRELPHEIKVNKAHNNFFLLPLLLGIAGCVYHFRKQKNDAVVVFLLFLFTGLAIAFYLNQPPVEPRERDYAFAGSFYAFSIWIGLGVPVLAETVGKILKNPMAVAAFSVILSLSVPGIMVAQGYDDHNRAGRTIAIDFARNVLESCAPNAILFTNGDNDTFPLWYAQEVEGIRTDVRVIVMTYSNTDWYIEQMTRQAYKSAPLPISLKPENYQYSTNNYLPFVENPVVKNGIDLKQFIALVNQNHPALQVTSQDGRQFTSLPSKKFFLNIDKNAVLKSGIIPKDQENFIADRMEWSISGNGMEKNQLIISDIIATNNWQRPVCFSATANIDAIGSLKPYLQLNGLTYQLLPVKNPAQTAEAFANRNLMYQTLVEKAVYRNLNNPDIYFDDIYQSQIVSLTRQKLALLATDCLNAGETDKAKKAIDVALRILPDDSLPYDYTAAAFVELLAKTGQEKRADDLFKTLSERVKKSLSYYSNLPHYQLADREIQSNLAMLQYLAFAARNLNKPGAPELESLFMKYYELVR